MRSVNVHEAKTHLSQLLEDALSGQTILIARAGTPVARLAPLHEGPPVRRPGLLRGKIQIADDFDAPLPEPSCGPAERTK